MDCLPLLHSVPLAARAKNKVSTLSTQVAIAPLPSQQFQFHSIHLTITEMKCFEMHELLAMLVPMSWRLPTICFYLLRLNLCVDSSNENLIFEHLAWEQERVPAACIWKSLLTQNLLLRQCRQRFQHLYFWRQTFVFRMRELNFIRSDRIVPLVNPWPSSNTSLRDARQLLKSTEFD